MTPEQLAAWETMQREGIVYRPAKQTERSVIKPLPDRPPMTTRQGGKIRVLTMADISKLRRGESLE